MPKTPPNPATFVPLLKIANAGQMISAIEAKRGSRLMCLVYNENHPYASALVFPVKAPLHGRNLPRPGAATPPASCRKKESSLQEAEAEA